MSLIGLTGYAQVGKDTVGRILVEQHGFKRTAFADPLRKGLLALDPWILLGEGVGFARLSHLVGVHGWDNAKTDYPEVRVLLQRYGTEAGRNIHGQGCWIEAWHRSCSNIGSDIVVTDVRFENEADEIHRLGGEVWCITRPGFEPVNAHVSDKGLGDEYYDLVLHNQRDVAYLEQLVQAAFNERLS